MARFIIKRLFICAFILFFVMLIIYVIMRSLPQSFIDSVAQEMTKRPGNVKSKEEWLRELNAVYGGNVNIINGFLVGSEMRSKAISVIPGFTAVLQ